MIERIRLELSGDTCLQCGKLMTHIESKNGWENGDEKYKSEIWECNPCGLLIESQYKLSSILLKIK